MATQFCMQPVFRYFVTNVTPVATVRCLEKGTLQHIRKVHHCHFKLPSEATFKGKLWNSFQLEGADCWPQRMLPLRRLSDRGGKYYTANKNTSVYLAAVAVFVLGLSYAAVPLYRLYCQVCECVCTLQHVCMYEHVTVCARKGETVNVCAHGIYWKWLSVGPLIHMLAPFVDRPLAMEARFPRLMQVKRWRRCSQ